MYIGQSINIRKRWADYAKPERAKFQVRLYKSFLKYGVSSHKFEVLYQLPNDVSNEVLTTYEQFYIDQLKSGGYELMNIRDAGNRGRISVETRIKMSQRAKGRKHSSQTKAHLSKIRKGKPSPRKGVKLAIEQIEKCRMAMKGKRHSAETRLKISVNNAKNNLGKPASAQMILKNRLAHLGKKASEETKLKMSQTHSGRPKSKEHNIKVSIALKKFHERKRINSLISTFGMIWNYKPCLSFQLEHFFPAPPLFDVHSSIRPSVL